jgi:hypothetical protein
MWKVLPPALARGPGCRLNAVTEFIFVSTDSECHEVKVLRMLVGALLGLPCRLLAQISRPVWETDDSLFTRIVDELSE